MSLEGWQDRLERHFAELAATRAESGFPLFALEHNLFTEEFAEIGGLLRSRLSAGLSLSKHWLVWVVYATELGYDYDGEEYWRSFEERTPHWENTGRGQLRTCFYKFRDVYHGVEPSGPWADWFSIIAWPVTHSILPKYLQLQFAKALYGARYRLAGLNALDAAEIGRLLAANACDASSRFRVFLEQEELVGRIVLALLATRLLDGQSPIYTPTLQRIVSDLERVHRAREWLKETKSLVANRFRGVGRYRIAAPDGRDPAQGGPRNVVPAGIRPTLLLRPSGTAKWSVVIQMPNLGSIAKLNPDFRRFLCATRCRVVGAGDNWLPGGSLLSGLQTQALLKDWPASTEPLVKFEGPHPLLGHLLDSECRLTSGPIWLCRIGQDRIAREIVGRIVRPGRRYIALSRTRLPSDHHLITPCTLDCTGINAGLLSLPETVCAEDIKWLQRLGLQVARTIRIWPAGLSGRSWDGEGQGEWLTTETPCFGLVNDHPVDAYTLCLNDGAPTTIVAGRVGHPIFLRIPPLPAGRHSLSVKAHCSGISPVRPPSQATEGFVTLYIREPEPWIPGTTLHSGIAVSIDPHDATLDMFWEGSVGVSILGPKGYSVTGLMSLLNASGAEILSRQIGMFRLPLQEGEWVKRVKSLISDTKDAWTVLEAASARLIIRSEELGDFVVRLDRDVKPLRWVCRSVLRDTIVRLIDETDQDETSAPRFYSFRQPAMPVPLDEASLRAGLEPEGPGGLYIALHGQHRDTLIVSTPQVQSTFKGLVIEPDLRDLQAGSIPVSALLRMLGLWSEARLAGALAGIRRDYVTRGILACLCLRLYGNRWAKIEVAYLSNPRSAFLSRQLEQSIGGPPGFGATLSREQGRREVGTDPLAQWFEEAAARYHVCLEPRLCEFALRLASEPQRLFSIFGAELDGWLHQISDKTVLLRGARLLALRAATNAPGGFSTAISR